MSPAPVCERLRKMLQAKVRLFESAEALPNVRRYVNERFGERWDEYVDCFSEQMQRMEGVSWETNNWVVLYRVYPSRCADIEASLHPANLRVVLKADAAREQAILAQDLHRRERPSATTARPPQQQEGAARTSCKERESTVRGAIVRALMTAREDGAAIDPLAIANEIGVEELQEHIEHLRQQTHARFDWKGCGRSWDIFPRRPLIVYECVREGLKPGQLVAVSSSDIPAQQRQLRAEADRVLCGRIMRKWGLEEPRVAACALPGRDVSHDEMLLDALAKLWNRANGRGCAPLPRERVRMDRLSTAIEYQLYCHNRQLPVRKHLSWDNMSIRWALRYKTGTAFGVINEHPDSNVIVTRL
jgi:hypothetical protein